MDRIGLGDGGHAGRAKQTGRDAATECKQTITENEQSIHKQNQQTIPKSQQTIPSFLQITSHRFIQITFYRLISPYDPQSSELYTFRSQSSKERRFPGPSRLHFLGRSLASSSTATRRTTQTTCPANPATQQTSQHHRDGVLPKQSILLEPRVCYKQSNTMCD